MFAEINAVDLDDLESLCVKCQGKGTLTVCFPTLRSRPTTTCPACHGAGSIPTEDGQRILDFVLRHLRTSS